jgi:hypothetical protein
MSHYQTLFLVHMYNDTLKRRNLERDGVPRASIGMGGHLKPRVGQRCPRPFTRAYRVSSFVVAYILITHLCRTGIHHAAFKTGLYDAKQIVPQVKIAIFDGNDVKFAVLTVYTEIDEYELNFFDGIAWMHGALGILEVGFCVELGAQILFLLTLYRSQYQAYHSLNQSFCYGFAM